MMASVALAQRPRSLFSNYTPLPGVFDELLAQDGEPHRHARSVMRALDDMSPGELSRCQALAERALVSQGVTFSVYSDQRGTEKILPFCVVPRVISAAEWRPLEAGLKQRMQALEMFLDDIYGPQRILMEKVVPEDMILGAKGYVPRLRHIGPPGGVRVHIAGVDLIRDPEGTFRVLEDNLRTPSGVSYVLQNRLVTKRVLKPTLEQAGVRNVDDYPAELADTLRSVSPVHPDETEVVVLTPGPYNSAYFEHSFLARMMGVELVEPSDLFVDDEMVFVRTTAGPRRVHVVYRRIDDAYLDPEFFRPDSLLGVPGLMRAWAAGHVALVNAPGNGVCDDKAVYPFVPAMIRFYLSEEPKLEQVRTLVCAEESDRAYVLERIGELVVKAVDEAGGYGMLMGPQASAAERDEFRQRILAEPRRYIAQHRIELSTCPTWDESRGALGPRRVDLRPFILTRGSATGPSSWVLPGGLTRVALREGSYVVNSSQGGGSKDTWVQQESRS
jgi:uncharacterized circularly permuted ATP-grasp superfamily protein